MCSLKEPRKPDTMTARGAPMVKQQILKSRFAATITKLKNGIDLIRFCFSALALSLNFFANLARRPFFLDSYRLPCFSRCPLRNTSGDFIRWAPYPKVNCHVQKNKVYLL